MLRHAMPHGRKVGKTWVRRAWNLNCSAEVLGTGLLTRRQVTALDASAFRLTGIRPGRLDDESYSGECSFRFAASVHTMSH